MRKWLLLCIAFMICSSHDMFLKMDSYFLEPNQESVIKLYNGTFDRSENVITRDRMIDVSVVGHGVQTPMDTSHWSEKDSMTLLSITTGSPGTWVAGVSTRARNIALAAADFNDYLDHDGVVDMLEWRRENNALDKDAVEKYSKHVKVVYQVGDQLTDDYKHVLGYPIEFVLLDNPYEIHAGHALRAQLLWQGRPLKNQLVYYAGNGEDSGLGHTHGGDGHEHSHQEDESTTGGTTGNDHHHDALSQRTDENGMISIDITEGGIWYLRTIHLVHSDDPGLTHESNWATITFGIGEGHSHEGITSGGGLDYLLWVVGIIVLIGIFYFLRRNSQR